MAAVNIPVPEQQINFSFALGQIRSLYLQDALKKTIDDLQISKLDAELSTYVPEDSLKALAKHGLRGELLFPVPYLLETNPYLIGYYRLLLGFSQKEFYTTKFGISRFKTMEAKGTLTEYHKENLSALCMGLIGSAIELVAGIGVDRLSKEFLDDLAILTVGPQFRGGANVQKGIDAIATVFKAIHDIVEHAAIDASENRIELINAAGKKVLIEFAPDPDIVIKTEMTGTHFRNVIAIEVKGGEDFSNIHNRVGEAEKSHQKAKAAGYVECWTVVNVNKIDIEMAQKESPSTNIFYRQSSLDSGSGEEYMDFKSRILSLTGIRDKK